MYAKTDEMPVTNAVGVIKNSPEQNSAISRELVLQAIEDGCNTLKGISLHTGLPLDIVRCEVSAP